MKKIKTILLLIFSIASFVATAQSNWEAGLRVGENVSFDATIPLASAPRLHPAVYFDRFGIATYFDWLFAFSDGPAGLKIYPGVGPEVFFGNEADFQIAGNFGMEYSFDFPLTLGFDWRPAVRLTNNTGFYSGNWGFIARFRFGQASRLRRVD
jgi:hypothetical protein